MATGLPQDHTATVPSGKGNKFGIVVSNYNHSITSKLLSGCVETLTAHEVPEDQIETMYVPGAFELPMGARILLGKGKYDAIICLGCVIKGETRHDEYINHAVSVGIMQLSLTSNVPVIFGVLTPDNVEQAEARAGGTLGNKGIEAAETALHMAALRKSSGKITQKIGFS